MNMKKITLVIACFSLLSLTSCFKKDRKCVCNYTYTDSSGTTTTDPEDHEITLKEIKKRDAKSLCQKTTEVEVDDDGDTWTYVTDCKLK
jgi:uncharacterized Zn ribbon protein